MLHGAQHNKKDAVKMLIRTVHTSRSQKNQTDAYKERAENLLALHNAVYQQGKSAGKPVLILCGVNSEHPLRLAATLAIPCSPPQPTAPSLPHLTVLSCSTAAPGSSTEGLHSLLVCTGPPRSVVPCGCHQEDTLSSEPET